MKLYAVLLVLVLSCVVLEQSDALRLSRGFGWRPRFRWIRPSRNSWFQWVRRPFPGPVGKISPPVIGRDVDTEVDQDEFQDFDDAELEKLLNERDVVDYMEEFDDDDDNL